MQGAAAEQICPIAGGAQAKAELIDRVDARDLTERAGAANTNKLVGGVQAAGSGQSSESAGGWLHPNLEAAEARDVDHAARQQKCSRAVATDRDRRLRAGCIERSAANVEGSGPRGCRTDLHRLVAGEVQHAACLVILTAPGKPDDQRLHVERVRRLREHVQAARAVVADAELCDSPNAKVEGHHAGGVIDIR